MNVVRQGPLADMGRLLMESVCSDIVRFHHSKGDPAQFEAVRIDREYGLGTPDAFADLRVDPRDEPAYFLEVKYGYDAATILSHIKRKYGSVTDAIGDVRKVVLVAETARYEDWPSVEAALRASLPTDLSLDVWGEAKLQDLIGQCFRRTIPSFDESDLVSIRGIIDEGKERLAFGDQEPTTYAERVLRQSLLWHFGAWRLRELRHLKEGDGFTQIVPPGVYENVVVLMADLSSFSRYVRDTPDDETVRQSLTNFYEKSRYQVINAGGMLVQFVGDEVVALFGIPDRRSGYVEAAVHTAIRLLDIGASVSHDWQRRIDHVQSRRGVHIGMAMGQVQVVAMRSLDNARIATIGDCLNIAARLLPVAESGEVVISNVLRHALRNSDYATEQLEPVEVRNLGTLQPWRLVL